MRKIFCVIIIFLMITPAIAGPGIRVAGKAVKIIDGGGANQFMRPVWSPDGSRIAFTNVKYQGIWVMNADGSNVRQVTDEAAAGFGFEWSPDSRAIVARVAKFEKWFRYNAIKIFDLKSGKSRLLSDYRTFMPALPHWAADGEKVCMFSRGRLEVFDTGRSAVSLKKAAASQQIYFLKDDHIAVGNIATKRYRVLEPIPGEQYLNLVVSPDRSRIAFEVLGGNLFVMNSVGSGLTDLGPGHRPQWAPDSETLVFMMTIDDGYRYLAADIYVIKFDGTEKTRLTETDNKLEMNPSWCPDGKKIAYDVLGEGAIYVLPIAR